MSVIANIWAPAARIASFSARRREMARSREMIAMPAAATLGIHSVSRAAVCWIGHGVNSHRDVCRVLSSPGNVTSGRARMSTWASPRVSASTYQRAIPSLARDLERPEPGHGQPDVPCAGHTLLE